MKPRVQLIGTLLAVGLLAMVQSHFRQWPDLGSDGTGAEEIGRSRLVGSKVTFQASNATAELAPSVPAEPPYAAAAAPTDAFQEFHAWMHGYLAMPSEGRAMAEADGLTLAKTRRMELRRLIANDPERAWKLRIPWSARRELPAAIKEHLEDIVTGRGDLLVFGVVRLPGQTNGFRPVQRVATLGSRSYETFVFGRRMSQPTCSGISMHGIAIDNVLALSDSPVRVLEPGEPPAVGKLFSGDTCPVSGRSVVTGATSRQEGAITVESGSDAFHLCSSVHVAALENALWQQEAVAPSVEFDNLGDKPVLVMPVDFSDLPGANVATNDALSVMNGVGQFYRANSFQQFSIYPVVTPVLRMSRPSTAYVTLGYVQLLFDARAAAAALGFRETDYRFDIVTFRSIGFPWGGLGFIRGKGAFVQGPSFSLATVEHELGHNLGNWHAGGWLAGDESVIGAGQRLEYGNEFDIMGSGLGHLNANFKFIAGWLTEANILTVVDGGTYRIHAMDTGAELNAAHFYGLRVPAAPPLHGQPSDYWIDFRQQFTNNPLAMSGALVHWATNTPGPNHCQLLDMNPGGVVGFRDAPLAVGRTFSDAPRGIFITPITKGGSGGDAWLDIAVRFHPTNRFLPVVSLSASSLVANPGETIQFTVTASDLDGDDLAYFWDLGDGSVLAGSLNQFSVIKNWAVAGEYVARCIVSDMKGGEAIASVLVRVGNPTTYHIGGRVLWQGNPLQGVRINNGLAGPDYRTAWTDNEGRFALVGLSAGSYLLRAVKPGFISFAAFTNPVSVGPQHVEDLTFHVETNTASFVTGFVPPSGYVGSTVSIRGVNLSYLAWPDGVHFAGAVGSPPTYYSSTEIKAVVPLGAFTGPVVLNFWNGVSATSIVPFVVLPTAPGILLQPGNQTNGFGFDAVFRVTATGSGPFAYQWRKDGLAIPGGTNQVLTVTNLQSEHGGGYDVIVANPVGSITSSVAWLELVQAPTFEEALDTTNFVWTTGGDAGWRTQTNITHDGVDAAETGELSLASDECWLETTVHGPGMLRFRYYRSPQMYLLMRYGESPDRLTNLVHLSQNLGWWLEEVRIPSGPQILRWLASTFAPEALPTARLDQVSFAPGLPPFITQGPTSLTVPIGSNVTFEVRAEGSGPLFYQWFFDIYHDPIPDATNMTYTIRNAQPSDDGWYSVRVYNAIAEAESQLARLDVVGPPIPVISLAPEVDPGNVAFAITAPWSPFDIRQLEVFDSSTRLVNLTNLRGGTWFPLTLSNLPPGRRLSLLAVATDSMGQVGTSAVVNAAVVQKLIPRAGSWKYLDDGSVPGPTWRELNFNDGQWLFGAATFGYAPTTWDISRPPITTVVRFGPDPTNKLITTWFRRTFNVPTVVGLSNAVLWMNRDDGAVVYLNGIEIFRSNMSDGEIGAHTLATASVQGGEHAGFFPNPIPSNLFVSGTNILAVEVHQADPASEDMYFDLSLTAYLPSEPSVAVISPGTYELIPGDTVPLRAVAVDPDGEIAWVEFFFEGGRIGQVTAPPYTMVWSNAPILQDYLTVTARATDNSGATSAPAATMFSVLGSPGRVGMYFSGPWRYLDNGAALDPNWRETYFDTEDWNYGDPVLGTGPLANTEINIGPIDARYPTTYFRASLTLDSDSGPPRLTNFTLHLLCELGDGAIAYFNGVEIFRSFLPAGPVSPGDYTGHLSGGIGWLQAPVDIGLLRSYNVVAVEMHQNSPDSDQLIFDLRLTGHLDLSEPELNMARTEEELLLRWEPRWFWDADIEAWVRGYGSLEEAIQVTGPWELVDDFRPGNHLVNLSGKTPRFFRLRWP